MEAWSIMTENPVDLKIIAFPGAPNLPLFAAMQRGFFAAAGLTIDFATTPSSVYQFERFTAGGCDIAFTAFDNIVAYREGQGAAMLARPPRLPSPDGRDAIRAEPHRVARHRARSDLKGKSLALDAVSTGFAFVLYAMLEHLGLAEGDYERVAVGATPDAGNPSRPARMQARSPSSRSRALPARRDIHVLARSTDFFPSYQGGIVAARRDWAADHPDLARRFIRAYLAGLDWTLDPANRAEAAALLLARMPDIKPGLADAVMDERAVASFRVDAGRRRPAGRHARGARAALALRATATEADRHRQVSRPVVLRRRPWRPAGAGTVTMAERSFTAVGQPLRRKEDQRLITGRGRFTDDFSLPGQAYAVMVRSPYPHARILRIDSAWRCRSPGCWPSTPAPTASADGLGPLPHNPVPSTRFDVKLTGRNGTPVFIGPHLLLPADKARHVGEAVAMVVAETRDAAQSRRRSGDRGVRGAAVCGRYRAGGRARCAAAVG